MKARAVSSFIAAGGADGMASVKERGWADLSKVKLRPYNVCWK